MLLVLSGDITQRATRAQFAAARAFVDRLGVPACWPFRATTTFRCSTWVHAASGPTRRYRRAFGDELEPPVRIGRLLVLGVNTTRRYRHVDGELVAAQIERVARAAAIAPRRASCAWW